MTWNKEKTFKEWLEENPEEKEKLKRNQFNVVSKPLKFCWGLNLNTTFEEARKLYEEGKIKIQSPKVEKQLTSYGQQKLQEEKKTKELVEEIKNQVLKTKKSND